MIELHQLTPSAKRTRYKRVGRGNASGKGTTAGRGTKGQRARTGGRNKLTRRSMKALIERTPKTRGFKSLRPQLEIVTLQRLTDTFKDGQIITPVQMVLAGLIDHARPGVKIIGQGKIAKKLTVKAQKFSAGAKAAIVAAGGSAVSLNDKE
jgi:large subunit ribosomal protein L15